MLVRGAQAGPLEDSGGIHSYHQLLATLRNPAAPDHEDVRAWVQGSPGPWHPPFAADLVDVERVNRMLDSHFASQLPAGWRLELHALDRMPRGTREVALEQRPVLKPKAPSLARMCGPARDTRWYLRSIRRPSDT